ncbi:ACP S-malonyltransferase [Paenibacillus assamensis]|uniref:ACP S-malonyltransferase n=1 Tax=Paenibacillus assamensis TaxID=311244 RepID=UPI000421146D|nr:ACP S-malonyltransferase [Paenibacillus assamensis]
MSKIAFVFPGQGAQSIGMGKDVYEANPASREIFERANRVLGYNLTDIIFNGPEELLKQTIHTQPALVTVSYALYTAFAERGIRPDYLAGHSLGEYSALAVAGVMSFEDAVATVRKRGEYMEAAVPKGQGAMAAVLGAGREQLGALCDDISAFRAPVEMANINCPGQIVISGSADGVQAVVERGKEAGAKRVIPLEVSGPFHSSLMQPAADQLSDAFDQVSLQNTQIPIVSNVSAQAEQEAGRIRQLLVEQVCSPVLWEDSIRYMIGQGVDTFIELGSGTVLAGLIKKIDRSVKVVSINSLESLEAFQLQA